MLLVSLNLIAPDATSTIYNLSINNSGTLVLAENIDPNAVGINSILVSNNFAITLDALGDLEVVPRSQVTTPSFEPVWFRSPNGNTYRLGADESGNLTITQAAYEEQPGTPFYIIYCRFLSKITDDLYLEWTLEDTFKNLESIFLDVIPLFEWPKFPLFGYSLNTIGMVSPDGAVVSYGKYGSNLTLEEIDIFASLMSAEWLNRQVLTVNLTRMKYSSKDFQFTSQANHIDKLLSTKNLFDSNNKRMQRMYQRRELDASGRATPNYAGLAVSSVSYRWRLAYSGTGWVNGSPVIGGAWWTESLSSLYGGFAAGDPFTEAYIAALGGSGTLINPRDLLI